MSGTTVTVIGSGIQGCLVALDLCRHGYKVHLVEQSEGLYRQASAQGEGKVHLGFIYARDKTMATAERLLLDALLFGPLLEDLLGIPISWSSLKSTRFDYLIATDSIMDQDALLQHYALIDDKYRALIVDPQLSYLGSRPNRLFTLPDKAKHVHYAPGRVALVCPTEELAVETDRLRTLILAKVHSSDIILHTSHVVVDIQRKSYGFSTICRQDRSRVQIPSDLVVNAAWAGKRMIDHYLGVRDYGVWSLRMKMGLVFHNFQTVRESFSMVLGSYGDLVVYPDSRKLYLSWYQHGMVFQSEELDLPQFWKDVCRGSYHRSFFKSAMDATVREFKDLCGELLLTTDPEIRIGAIMARGKRSISDPRSGLHRRNDPPIMANDGYFSINTGKFTSAPHNARKLLQLLK